MSDLTSIESFWNTAAPSFDEEADHGLLDPQVRAAWDRRLRSWLPAAPSRVLDLGCGTGSVSLLLKGQGHLLVGVDLSPRMVERARQKVSMAGVEFPLLVGDASDPPAEAGDAFDVVLTRHLLWTLPDPAGALVRWIRLLRPGGRLVLIEGRWDVTADAAPYVAGTRHLPWNGGVTAEDLAGAVRPLVGELWSEPLDDPDLWGRAIHDERYALIAQV